MKFKIGDRVRDKSGNEGVIISIKDKHNIEVEYHKHYSYDRVGFGIYCVDKSCKEYDELFLIEQEDKECIVYGCKNRRSQGRFVGEICASCYEMIVTGNMKMLSENFIHKMYLNICTLSDLVDKYTKN